MLQAGSGLPPDLEFAFKLLSVVGGTLAAIGALIGFGIRLYWDKRQAQQAEQMALASQRASLREALISSLSWFEGGTQKRSIGLGIVTASWDEFPELQAVWLGILANQAVYLLAVADQKEELHKITNLRRIMDILVRERARLDSIAQSSLRQALGHRIAAAREHRQTQGVNVELMELNDWWERLGFNQARQPDDAR